MTRTKKWDESSQMSGPRVELVGHLLLPHKPTHPLNLLDLLFFNIKYFFGSKSLHIYQWTTSLFQKNETVFCVLARKSRNHSNCSMVLAAPLQHGAESTCAFRLLPSAAKTTIGTDWYHILQRVGGHWSPLIQIATDDGSRWEKSEFRL